MIVKANSRFGNFAWVAEVEVDEEMTAILLPFAITQILQRSPSSEAEKLMAKYEKRPEGFKRDSIPFSEANAKILAKALEGAKVSVGEGKDAKELELSLTANVEEYVPTVSESKFTEERAILTRHETKGDKEEWLKNSVGFTGDQKDEQAVLVAVREFKKAALKGL